MIVGKAALIINEGQRGVIDPMISFLPALAGQVAQRAIIPKIATLADAFRRRGYPVVHAPVAHRADYLDVKRNSLLGAMTLKQRKLTQGTVESSYVPELEPHDGDFEISRTSGSVVMCGTQLDAMLRRMDVSTIVLTGVSTNVAIPANAMVASELGYHVVVPEDCIAGSDADTHATIVENQLRLVARIVSSDDLIAALDLQAQAEAAEATAAR
jgi:nicotinamidase-related amidase